MSRTNLQLKRGDFIKGEFGGSSEQSPPIFGVVSHVEATEFIRYQNLLYCTQYADCFLDGVIDQKDERGLYTGRKGNDIQKLSKEESLDFLQKVWGQFEKEIKKGGLGGALFARRQHNLEIVMDIIKETSHPLEAIERVFPTPETGRYVLQAYVRGQEFLDGLFTEPRRDEKEVAKLAGIHLPKGTRKIPPEYKGVKLSTNDFRAYEIPERGIHLVEDPIKLASSVCRDSGI